ncbi:MAG: hypothetical protein RLW87_08625 [Alphaproteobacteria bacterium]
MTKEGLWVKRLAIVFVAFIVAMVGAELLDMPQLSLAMGIARDIVFILLIVAGIRWWWRKRKGRLTPLQEVRSTAPQRREGKQDWTAGVLPNRGRNRR